MNPREQAAIAKYLSKFYNDPYKFVLAAFRWGHDSLETYKGPEEWQKKVLLQISDRMKQNRMDTFEAAQIAISSGHGIGKSCLVAWIILWTMMTKVDARGVVTANTENQLKTKTWAELAKWHNLFLGKDLFKLTATAIYRDDPSHERTWRIDMVPWSEHKTEAFAGLHNKGRRILVIMDEASAIPDKIWEVTEGALTDEQTEIIWCAFGNPTRNTGRFYDCFNRFKHRWKHAQVDSREVTITNKEQIKRWEDDYGEDSDFFKVRVRGEFPDVSDLQFIPTTLANGANGRKLNPFQYANEPVIIGVDPAWSGSDAFVIRMRQGLYSKRLALWMGLQDDAKAAGHIARFEDEYKADAVFIDHGYGTGIFSFGKQMGRKWQLINFGGESLDEMFANKRGEMWGAMRQWLKDGGAFEHNDDLVRELTSPEHYVRTTKPHAGKIILESKEDMKKRNLASPNDADALALTFAFPVMTKSQKQFMRLKQSQDDSYDPLDMNRKPVQDVDYNPLSPLAQV
jgi:hypothetical protein